MVTRSTESDPRLHEGGVPALATALLGLLGVWVAAQPAVAVDVSGFASLVRSSIDTSGIETDTGEDSFGLYLRQQMTPYVSVDLGYSYFDFATSSAQSETGRRTRAPRVQLRYQRGQLSARIAVADSVTDGTSVTDNFEVESLTASVNWRGNQYGLSAVYREDTNVADQSVFGRDTVTGRLSLLSYFQRPFWRISYTYEDTQIDNDDTRFRSDQQRHGVRLSASRSIAGDRLSLSFSSLVDRVERLSGLPEDGEFLDPIRPSEGLFAIDTTPAVGELGPEPALIDGDLATPTRIEIGGGNTFRNVGLDVGLIIPMTNLEISVDRISASDVRWEVYVSSDNLIWEPVAGVSSSFDTALLRYELRFPRIETRFVKAVNVSFNAEAIVRVTEIRALLQLAVSGGLDEFQSTLYRVNAGASFHPASRVRVSVDVGTTNDEDVSDGFVRREYSVVFANAGVSVDLREDLGLRLAYRYEDAEDIRQDPLLRTLESYGAVLRWTPLDTVDTTVSVQAREESEEGEVLQTVRSARLRTDMDILPVLRLISDVSLSRLEEPMSGTSRDGLLWAETVIAEPTDGWQLSMTYTFNETDTVDGGPGLRRQDVQLWTTWTVSPELSLTGSWAKALEGPNDSVRQNYGLSYNPGPRLSISATYQEYDTSGGATTASDSLGALYRVTSGIVVFGNVSRSRSAFAGTGGQDVTSLRIGIRAGF